MLKISALLSLLTLSLLVIPARPGLAQNMQRQPADGSPHVWFAPLDSVADYGYRGVSDFMQLFKDDTVWPKALSRIEVIKLYSQFVDQASEEQLRTVVQFLNTHNIKIAVETWVLHHGPNSCGYRPNGDNIEGYLPRGREDLPDSLARRIRTAGGVISYVAIDESYAANKDQHGCHLSKDEAAKDVGSVLTTYKTYFPDVRLGDIENLPGTATQPWMDDYFDWADAIQNVTGAPLAFFHMDVDWNSPNWGDAIPAFVQRLNERGIPFGTIQNGTFGSQANWMASAMNNVLRYRSRGLPAPQHVIFQSWEAYPKTALPEDHPSGLLYLINFYFAAPQKLHSALSIPIYRFYNRQTGEHFYTVGTAEGLNGGYAYEGIGFYVLAEPMGGTVPIYRCYNGSMHFMSRADDCEGNGRLEGLYGHLYASPDEGGLPLKRFFCPSNGDHLETIAPLAESIADCKLEGDMGYAPRQ
ncbi:MAG: hypothetical protein QOF41_2242 [Methylobacteriaceae bacterium]|nr:hypothetical protein [Methylobacteriaceae bacterium]